jgi:hypothetical protein
MPVPMIRSAFPVFSYQFAQPRLVKLRLRYGAATAGPVFSLTPTLKDSSDAP